MYVDNYQAPFGNIILHCSDRGLTKVELGCSHSVAPHPIIKKAKTELDEYFQGLRRNFSVELDVEGTDFQKKTWKTLREIPFGKVLSYKELAQKVASPKHSRAVANANNKNKLPIFIPCHRVIGSDGTLVGFAWGLHVKKLLLEKEGVEAGSTPSTHKRENT